MKLIILGDLNITQEQSVILNNLVDSYKQFNRFNDEINIKKELLNTDIVFCCNFNLNNYISDLKNTKLVVMAETGIVNIDIEKARLNNINVVNLKTYSKVAVAEYVLYCLLDSLRPWKTLFDKNFDRKSLHTLYSEEINSLKVGIVGFGTIGEYINRILSVLNCNITATYSNTFSNYDINFEKIEDIFKTADRVIVSCSLNNSSYNLIDNRLLSLMKKDSGIISISSRQVFNTNELYKFLNIRKDVNAYIDFDMINEDVNICNLDNVHISNHIAFYTRQTILNRTNQCIDILKNFIIKKEKGEEDENSSCFD